MFNKLFFYGGVREEIKLGEQQFGYKLQREKENVKEN